MVWFPASSTEGLRVKVLSPLSVHPFTVDTLNAPMAALGLVPRTNPVGSPLQ